MFVSGLKSRKYWVIPVLILLQNVLNDSYLLKSAFDEIVIQPLRISCLNVDSTFESTQSPCCYLDAG